MHVVETTDGLLRIMAGQVDSMNFHFISEKTESKSESDERTLGMNESVSLSLSLFLS